MILSPSYTCVSIGERERDQHGEGGPFRPTARVTYPYHYPSSIPYPSHSSLPWGQGYGERMSESERDSERRRRIAVAVSVSSPIQWREHWRAKRKTVKSLIPIPFPSLTTNPPLGLILLMRVVVGKGEGRDKGNRVVVTLPVGPCPPPLFDPAAPYPRLAFPFVGSCRGSPSLPLSFSYLFNNERKGRRLTEPHGVGYNRMTVKRERNERERARPCQPSFVFFSSLYSLATPTIPRGG